MNEKQKQESDLLIKGQDGKWRCWWCGDDELYLKYHDEQWGRQEKDDFRLFEKICLEGFQAGLSWITILRKREAFRLAFENFDFYKVSKFEQADIDRLVQDAGIVRHKGKIKSTINNANHAIKMKDEFGSLYDFFKQYQPKKNTTFKNRSEVPATTPESTQLSKDLKKRGWSFVGPTTCYAFMQAMGLVNDHASGCYVFNQCKKGRAK